MTDPLASRAPRHDDIPAILSLFETAFGKTISAEHYRWKLQSRRSPAENVVIAVDDSDRPVFHSAGIPCRCVIGGVEYWVMLGADVMTAPAYRRRGFNTRYSAALYARWKAAGVALIVGFSNEQWGSSAYQVGLRPFGQLASLIYPIRPERLLARKLKLPFLGRVEMLGRLWGLLRRHREKGDQKVRVEEVRKPGPAFDQLWQKIRGQVEPSMVRDLSWVRWRYFEDPSHRYRVFLARRNAQPVGYAAFSQDDKVTATIAEIVTSRQDISAFATLLRLIQVTVRASSVEVLRTLAVPGSWPYERYRRAGFVVRSKGVVEHILLDPAVTVPDAKDWFFTAADFDAV
jgi:hypothetical protein